MSIAGVGWPVGSQTSRIRWIDDRVPTARDGGSGSGASGPRVARTEIMNGPKSIQGTRRR
jgi:hypothetical protein